MPYLGGHYWLWLTLTTALFGAVWFVWQFERGGFEAAVPSTLEQDETTRKAQALLEQMQQDNANLKEGAQNLARDLGRKAAFVIHDASFFGRSSAGENWRVEAEKAAQPDGEKLIYLQTLTATVEQDGWRDVVLEAPTGLLDDQQDLLLLNDGFAGTVYSYKTKGAQADYQLKKQDIRGRGLDVAGDSLKLSARQFEANLDAEKASFQGDVQVQVTLNQNQNTLVLGRVR